MKRTADTGPKKTSTKSAEKSVGDVDVGVRGLDSSGFARSLDVVREFPAHGITGAKPVPTMRRRSSGARNTAGDTPSGPPAISRRTAAAPAFARDAKRDFTGWRTP
jgi:hypothetical protein